MNEQGRIESLIDQLSDPSADRAHKARQELEAMGDAAIDALTHAMNDTQGRGGWLAACALAAIDSERAVEPLIQRLLSPAIADPIRQMIAQVLGKRRDPRAVEPLIQSLDDSDAFIQMTVIDALGKLGDRRAVKPILSILTQTTSPVIRYTAIQSLTELGDPSAVPAILQYKDDDDDHVREYVDNALRKFAG